MVGSMKVLKYQDQLIWIGLATVVITGSAHVYFLRLASLMVYTAAMLFLLSVFIAMVVKSKP